MVKKEVKKEIVAKDAANSVKIICPYCCKETWKTPGIAVYCGNCRALTVFPGDRQ